MRSTILLLLTLLILTSAYAGSRQGHGIIKSVHQEKPTDAPTINIEGKFASHFSGQRFLPWTFSLKLSATGEKTGTYIYLVDGLLVPDSVGKKALVAGRRIAFTEDVIAIQTTNEFSEVGIVKSVNGDSFVMAKMENAEPGYGRPFGEKDFTFNLDADTEFLHDAKPASKTAVLKTGNYIRIIGKEAHTVSVIEPVEAIRSFPGNYKHSRYGTIIGYDSKTKMISALVQNPDGSVKQKSILARKHVSLDSHFLPRTAKSRFRLNAAFEAGREAFFFCHRNSKDPNEVYVQTKRKGEIKGRLDKVAGNTLTITTWQGGKVTAVEVKIESNARVLYNYRKTSAKEALKVGSWIHIIPGHKMQILSGRWDPPISADTKAPPTITSLKASTPLSGQVQLNWENASVIGMPTVSYQIYRDGKAIGTSLSPNYLDTNLGELKTYQYDIRAVNQWGKTSQAGNQVSIKTILDTILPKLTLVKANSKANTIELLFDKSMNMKAMNKENIGISNDVKIQSITSKDDHKHITLKTSDLTYSKAYAIILKNLTDASQSNNPFKASGAINVKAWPPLEITDMKVSSGKKYQLGEMKIKAKLFIDRNYLIKEMPEAYKGLTFIRTSMDDKNFKGEGTLSFTTNRPLRVRIMTTSRGLSARFKGYKLQDIEKFGLLGNSRYKAFAQDFTEAQTITLPIPLVTTKRNTMYWVLLETLD